MTRENGESTIASDKRLESPPIVDERGVDNAEMAERMERGIRRFLNTPPQPRGKSQKSPPAPKAKERPASKGRVHKGKGGR